MFADGKSTQAFAELDKAGVILEHKGQSRVEALADLIVKKWDEGRSAIALNPSHRENDAVAEAVRRRLKERGELTDERVIEAHRKRFILVNCWKWSSPGSRAGGRRGGVSWRTDEGKK